MGYFNKAINIGSASTPSVSILYFGSPTVDGSYRIRIVDNDLVTERRESGVWIEKGAITPWKN